MIDKEFLQTMYQNLITNFDLSTNLSDQEIERLIEEEVFSQGLSRYISISDRITYKKTLFNSIRGLDVLQELVDDSSISEIMINGTKHIFIEKEGHIILSDIAFSSSEKLSDIIQQIASISNRRVNEASPIVDARLKDGSRVNIVLPPVSLDGPIVTIRKFFNHHITMDRLIELNSINELAAAFLKTLVCAGYNIFISGGTGSGKTTFLNVLSDFIPSDSRVITIEDSAELQLTNIKNLVRLETRMPNIEGNGEITMQDLIKTSLRMRPDRIIVGEVRGKEASDMITVLNTGHSGSMSTGHANSAKDMLSRLETMILMGANLPISAIRGQIATGIDIIVHLGRLRDKSRRVLDIAEITAFDGNSITVSSIFKFIDKDPTSKVVKGSLEFTGHRLTNTEKLLLAGLAEPIYQL
jgi:pilus assembly protein CpaF